MGPRFRACLGAAALTTAVLVACGGKVLEDSGSITIDGPSKKVGGGRTGSTSGQSGSSGSAINNGGDDGGLGYPYDPPPPLSVDSGAHVAAEIHDGIMAYAGPDPQGLSVDDHVHAFLHDGRLVGTDAVNPFPPDPTAGASNSWAWGSPAPTAGRFFYAFGEQMPPQGLSHVPGTAGFVLQGGGAIADERVDASEISAECSFSSSICKIHVSLRRGSRAVQFVPAATISGIEISGDGLSDKSHLRGGFTCGTKCALGNLAGFGMVIAFELEDDVTHEMLYGAAALPFFDPK